MVSVTLEHLTGDLFDLALPALVHGCNRSGSMAGGIAVSSRALGRHTYEEYDGRCRDGRFRLGDVMPWVLDDRRVVSKLATQQRPDRDARLDAIATLVAAMLRVGEDLDQPAGPGATPLLAPRPVVGWILSRADRPPA